MNHKKDCKCGPCRRNKGEKPTKLVKEDTVKLVNGPQVLLEGGECALNINGEIWRYEIKDIDDKYAHKPILYLVQTEGGIWNAGK